MCPFFLPQRACGSWINRAVFYSQFAIIWGRGMGRQLTPDSGKYLINTYTTGGLGQPNSNWLQLSYLGGSAPHSSLLPEGFSRGWKRLLQLLSNANTEKQVTVCIRGISSHLHSHVSPGCLQISVTSNLSNTSDLLHHIASSQIPDFTVHPFPTPGQTLLW